MPNPNGTPDNLVASHPGNGHAVRHGVWSRTGRVLAPRAREIADEILAAQHFSPLDAVGAEEIGSLVALIEACDRDIAERWLTRRGDVRKLVQVRLQASRRLQEWLAAYGLTPKGRADFAQTLATGGLAAEIARRRAQA